MSEIARILVPIYERRDSCPAYESALRLAEKLNASLLVAGVVDESEFVELAVAPPPGIFACKDQKAIEMFCSEVKKTTDALAARATERGVSAESVLADKSYPEAVVDLSRQCDLIVQSRLSRHVFLERNLFDQVDVYSDSSCPILIARGDGLSMSPLLLIYTHTRAANRALRLVARLAGGQETPDVHVLVLFRSPAEEERLTGEVAAYAEAHGVEASLASAPAKEGFWKVVELSKELRPGLVAMPTYAFPRPIRLRVHGIDPAALDDIGCSVLLFP